MAAKSTSKRLTMSDIARLARVSSPTVSRALNGSPLVNPETRARIQAIASAQGYWVRVSARNLRRGHAQTIAVLIPLVPASRQQISDLFFLELLGSIADALVDAEYDLLLSNPQQGDWQARFLGSGRADGIIVIGQAGHTAAIELVARARVPMAVWGAVERDADHCIVGSDNAGGAFRAVSHLVALGRRRIAFLGNAQLPEVRLRLAGYRRALRHHKLAFDPALYVATDFTVAAATNALQRLIHSATPFDAIFASSDVIAMTAIQTMTAAGIAVPARVAVVGYDDIRMAAAYTPALTTVRQNIEAGGRELVARVLSQVDGDKVGSMTLPTELVVRDSCGASAGGRG